jgi:peptide subunit release factor 1 (eRF1)
MKDEALSLRQLLARLRRLRGGETLTIYLPVRREGYDERYYSALLQDLVKRYRERLSEAERAVIGRELPRIQRRLESERPAGCEGLVAFGCEEAGLLELIRLPDPPEARLEVGAPLVAPIDRLLEAHPPALVAVIDKEKARVFGSILGELLPVAEIEGEQVKHSKAGGSSAPSNQRKADNRAVHNLREVAELVEREADGFYRELWVVGPPEARAEFIRSLPPHLRALHREITQASLDKPFGETLADVRERLVAV